MQSVKSSAALKDSVKSGIVAGQVAAWAIFGLFLSVDATLLTPPGTFYKMIGMALGQGPSTDVYTGFALHMATATAIGIVYMVVSNSVRQLYIGSVFKGLATGTMTGVAVWAVLFLPLHFVVMQPMLQGVAADQSSPNAELANRLVQLSGTIISGSLALHILFGGVLGFAGRLATSSGELLEKQPPQPEKQQQQ